MRTESLYDIPVIWPFKFSFSMHFSDFFLSLLIVQNAQIFVNIFFINRSEKARFWGDVNIFFRRLPYDSRHVRSKVRTIFFEFWWLRPKWRTDTTYNSITKWSTEFKMKCHQELYANEPCVLHSPVSCSSTTWWRRQPCSSNSASIHCATSSPQSTVFTLWNFITKILLEAPEVAHTDELFGWLQRSTRRCRQMSY